MSVVLKLKNLTKTYESAEVLHNISLSIHQGEVVALLGPSGCGKSTLLNLIAGLEKPDKGELSWAGENLRPIPPYQRGFGLMFQNYALFPHMNVFENIAFGLKMKNLGREDIQRRVYEMLHLVDLPGFDFRDVSTLSGGEQQRVALARALAPQPRLLMLDEPLGALDRTLRERLLLDIRTALKELEQTALYVTHDQEEAFAVADCVVVMHAGEIIQIGSPRDIYQNPHNEFVAEFLGMSNLFEGKLNLSPAGWMLVTPVGTFPITSLKQTVSPEFTRNRPVSVLLRPDAVFPTKANEPYRLQGVLLEKSFRGSRSQLIVNINNLNLNFELPAHISLPPIGEKLQLSFEPEEAIRYFITN